MLNGSLALSDITMSSYSVVNLFGVYFAPPLCFILFVLIFLAFFSCLFHGIFFLVLFFCNANS